MLYLFDDNEKDFLYINTSLNEIYFDFALNGNFIYTFVSRVKR